VIPTPTTAPLTLAELVRATQGRLAAGRPEGALGGVTIDSRAAVPGSVFFAIRGHRQDGHAFVADALARGARTLVLTRLPAGIGLPEDVGIVVVDDTTQALGRLAAFHRGRHAIPVVAITGSNGKTTTKELVALVLSRRFRVLRASGSFNNQWGLPLTLLGLGPEDQAAVVELGMSAPGEIAALARIAQPTVGVVTTIAPAHLEFLGSLEGVQKAKGELVEAIPPEGIVILNADDPLVLGLVRAARGRVVTFGADARADVRVVDLASAADGLTFSLRSGSTTVSVRLPLPGRHNAGNAAAAAAVGQVLGVSLAEAAGALADAVAVRGRLVWHEAGGVRVLDDTYNANPPSLRAALDVLREAGEAAGFGRTWVILGDMLELGALSETAHRDAGAWIAALPVAGLLAVGARARTAATAAQAVGCPDVTTWETPEGAAARLAGRLAAGDRVLVKGSRGMRMERAVETLLSELGAGARPC
jgi:UDP-N-acetylmuramoyl-tripeptide--D-alanyl-D-alanine ligase